jgi:hypothetical protein
MWDNTKSRPNLLGIVSYAFMILMLFEIVNENFGVNTLKTYFAVLAQIYFFKIILTSRRDAIAKNIINNDV